MLNLKGKGKIIGRIEKGKLDGKEIYIDGNSDNGYEELELKKSKILPCLDNKSNRVSYICGPSGSGKSTYVCECLKDYLEKYPDNIIFLFSRKTSDESYDKLGEDITWVKLDDPSVIENLDVRRDFPNSMLVFDDIDTIQNNGTRKNVYSVLNDALETGRDIDTCVISTCHLINGNDKKNMRTILNEAHTITVFPKFTLPRNVTYLLKEYLGYGKPEIDYVLKNPSRWVTLGKNAPQYIMDQYGVKTMECFKN